MQSVSDTGRSISSTLRRRRRSIYPASPGTSFTASLHWLLTITIRQRHDIPEQISQWSDDSDELMDNTHGHIPTQETLDIS